MKLKHLILVFGLFIISLQSCKKDPLFKEEINTTNAALRIPPEEGGYEEGEVILGDKLKNPYLVKNMEQAYNTLMEQGGFDCGQIRVRPTHYYVKFMPRSLEQYEVLDHDSLLNLSVYPLDYAIIQDGNSYHDPSVPKGEVTYQYAAVRIGYNFNDTIPYEIIDELYIPEEDENLVNDDNDDENNPNWDCIDKLLDQAYLQTGNYEDMLDPSTDYQRRRPRYRPGGNIQIFDTRLNSNIGMQGVKVRARRWFTVHVARPDENGNYRMRRTFRRPCNYSLWFSTNWFAVRRHLIATTHWINGPKITGDWNHTIADGYTRFVGHIFRGAYRYHYQDIDGLQRPFRPNFARQLYIGVDKEKSWSGENYMIFPVIRIARYQNSDGLEYGSDEIFSTACHETAHTSHVLRMNAGLIQYWQVDSQLQESWAVAIEWRLTHLEYAGRGISNYGEETYSPNPAPQYPNRYAYQYWTLNRNSTYTSLYINLVDNTNENGIFFPNVGVFGTVDDDVQGYSLAFIEQNILKHSYGLWSLGNELKSNKPTGVTDQQIDNLLSFY
jgi:hypothetical protein